MRKELPSSHSYLILAFTDSDEVALNVGFYYILSACGRLVGMLLSGLLFVVGELALDKRGVCPCCGVSLADAAEKRADRIKRNLQLII